MASQSRASHAASKRAAERVARFSMCAGGVEGCKRVGRPIGVEGFETYDPAVRAERAEPDVRRGEVAPARAVTARRRPSEDERVRTRGEHVVTALGEVLRHLERGGDRAD